MVDKGQLGRNRGRANDNRYATPGERLNVDLARDQMRRFSHGLGCDCVECSNIMVKHLENKFPNAKVTRVGTNHLPPGLVTQVTGSTMETNGVKHAEHYGVMVHTQEGVLYIDPIGAQMTHNIPDSFSHDLKILYGVE